jgi:hypothetical protein
MGERRNPDTGVITIDRLMILTQRAAQAPASVATAIPAAESKGKAPSLTSR